MSAAPVVVFSDFTCPFSYVTEAALWRLEDRGLARPRYGAWELFPTPTEPVAPADEPGWRDAVRPLAEPLGLELAAPAFRPRTRKAHEAFRFAQQRELGRPMRERIFRAYWSEQRDIGRVDVLTGLLAELGGEADPQELKIALDIDRYGPDVQRDQQTAERLGVRGVPVVYVGEGPDARILVGAQSAAALDAAVRNR